MPMVPLYTLVAEARQLGAEFRMSGSQLVVDKPDAIPAPLKKELRGRRDELCDMLASKSAQLLAATGDLVLLPELYRDELRFQALVPERQQ